MSEVPPGFGEEPVINVSTNLTLLMSNTGFDFRWHDLRHTWASWHVQNGTPLHELQQLGGWANYEMVLRYAHLSSEHLIMAAERVYDTS